MELRSSSLMTNAVGVAHVPAGSTVGFKALPTPTLPADASPPPSLADADWAGIYPQLNLTQAIVYLPNQFDRRHATACVVRLTNKQPLTVITCGASAFTDGSLAASAKAVMVRESVRCVGINMPELVPLMNACGEASIVLCLPDAEGFELVYPRAMFTQKWLDSELLFTFHESQTMPFTVGRVDQASHLHRSVLMDWDELARTLEATLASETQCALLQELVAKSVVSIKV